MSREYQRDWLTVNGARELAQHIEAYWRKHMPTGCRQPIMRIETGPVALVPGGRADVRGFVRSDMRGGFPPRA